MSSSTDLPRKRQYQPTIPAYFSRESTPNNTAFPAISPPPLVPTLPTTVQSSLINVGMRVRKAVPEGYKTKALDAVEVVGSGALQDRARSRNIGGISRELMPFCGILKVGGFAAQDQENLASGYGAVVPSISFRDRGGEESDEELRFQTSSQESVASTVSTDSAPLTLPFSLPKSRGKRSLDEGDGERDDLQKAYAIKDSAFSTGITTHHRPLAKTRRRRAGPPREALARRSLTLWAEDHDFEEAAFLRTREEVIEEMDLDAS